MVKAEKISRETIVSSVKRALRIFEPLPGSEIFAMFFMFERFGAITSFEGLCVCVAFMNKSNVLCVCLLIIYSFIYLHAIVNAIGRNYQQDGFTHGIYGTFYDRPNKYMYSRNISMFL